MSSLIATLSETIPQEAVVPLSESAPADHLLVRQHPSVVLAVPGHSEPDVGAVAPVSPNPVRGRASG